MLAVICSGLLSRVAAQLLLNPSDSAVPCIASILPVRHSTSPALLSRASSLPSLSQPSYALTLSHRAFLLSSLAFRR